MTLADIMNLYAYNRWANLLMFSSLEALSPEQFQQKIESSFPSVQETVFHIVFAEWIWLERWQGNSPTTRPNTYDFATLSLLRDFWQIVDQRRQNFIAALDLEKLNSSLEFRLLSGEQQSMELWKLMQHVVNHSSYHRGQVTTMLRQLGATPVDTDMFIYYKEPVQRASA